jgi:hypothetical protein
MTDDQFQVIVDLLDSLTSDVEQLKKRLESKINGISDRVDQIKRDTSSLMSR